MNIRRAIRERAIRTGCPAAEAALRGLGVAPPEVLMLLGHMRSGSTLLLHLLINHPLIAGLGERDAVYQTPADLVRLAIATRVRQRLPLARLRYVVDQINHTRFTPDLALLGHRRVRLLFLVRRPVGAISSLFELRRFYGPQWSVKHSVDYYVERLDSLAHMARMQSAPARAAFMTYEDLTERPRETLSRLQSRLEVEPAFSETYRIHEFTGRRGDPSKNIRSGRIGSASPLANPDLPREEIERATRAHSACLEAMAPFALLPQVTS
jgi:hypothetical protein